MATPPRSEPSLRTSTSGSPEATNLYETINSDDHYGGRCVGEFVNFEVSETGVGTIRLDRPKVNALNDHVAPRSVRRWRSRQRRTPGRVVIWVGSGCLRPVPTSRRWPRRRRGTCIGTSDISKTSSLVSTLPYSHRGDQRLRAGGGCEFALACDFRITAADAKLGQPRFFWG